MEEGASTDAILRELEELRSEVRRLRDEQTRADERLNAIARHPATRMLIGAAALAATWKAWAGQKLLHSPLHSLYERLRAGAPADAAYAEWSAWERRRTAAESCANPVRSGPLFSVLMPVRNPGREWLKAAVESVLAQSYPNWELSVCDDASTASWVREYLCAQAAADSRVRVCGLSAPGGVSAALNRAAESANGDYITFLDHDDELSPDALHCMAAALGGGAVLAYSDEEIIDGSGMPVRPVFKPDWSPDLLTSCMYLGHFMAVGRDLFRSAGGFRSEYDGAQDYDLALRVADSKPAAVHVRRVLYRWRAHRGSTAGRPAAKPGAAEAGRRALEDAVRRRGIRASVEAGSAPATYRVRRTADSGPLVSVIVCSRKPRLLEQCLRRLHKTTAYPNRETIVVEHRAGTDSRFDQVAHRHGYRRVLHSGPFDYAAMNNAAARAAGGEILLFYNDDAEPLDPRWLDALAAQAIRPEIGAAGALLLYPGGSIQHAGVVAGLVYGAGHPLRRRFASPLWPWTELTRNVSAVTGACLAMRKIVFDQLGGFDSAFPVNYNDVDLCLRARRAGYEVVLETLARLRHAESQTRIAFTPYSERDLFWKRWGEYAKRGDPFYSDHLTLASEDPALRWQP